MASREAQSAISLLVLNGCPAYGRSDLCVWMPTRECAEPDGISQFPFGHCQRRYPKRDLWPNLAKIRFWITQQMVNSLYALWRLHPVIGQDGQNGAFRWHTVRTLVVDRANSKGPTLGPRGIHI